MELLREIERRVANNEQIESLQLDLSQLNSQLAGVSNKLHEASVELNKEKARNKSATQHSEASLCYVT